LTELHLFTQIFKKILKFEDLVLFEKVIFVFKSKTNSLPRQFDNYLKEITQVYKKCTRSSNQDKYFTPYFKTSKVQKSIKYQGPLIWNALDINLKIFKSLKSFKINLKNSLLQKYKLPN